MNNLLLRWIVSTIAILITAYILPGVSVTGLMAALVAALVLGIVNALIRPLLVLLTLPITILTLGLFVLIINALLVLLTSAIVPGFYIASFGWALIFGIVQAIVMFFLGAMAGEE